MDWSAMARWRLAALACLALLVPACQGSGTGEIPAARAAVDVAAPLAAEDPYTIAAAIELPKTPPREWPGLHNVYRLSARVWSGSEPDGDAALAQLAALGIKVVVSVDGKAPDHATAAKHGIRYVHVPIKYSGVTSGQMLRLAKAFRELDGPFYTHCFHGKHRGPVAAAIGRLVLDGVPREQGLAEMRQWCGTSRSYAGLYRTVANLRIPTADETAAYDWDFPPAERLGGFRESMISAPRAYDHVAALAKREFAADPEHPDIDAVNEAAQLANIFAEAAQLPEVRQRPEDFRGWMAQSAAASAELRDALRAVPTEGAPAIERAQALVTRVDGLCTACHRVYRNE